MKNTILRVANLPEFALDFFYAQLWSKYAQLRLFYAQLSPKYAQLRPIYAQLAFHAPISTTSISQSPLPNNKKRPPDLPGRRLKLPDFIAFEIIYLSNFTLCRRKEFRTTDTELKAIAAPATHGARRPIAAIGMPTVL